MQFANKIGYAVTILRTLEHGFIVWLVLWQGSDSDKKPKEVPKSKGWMAEPKNSKKKVELEIPLLAPETPYFRKCFWSRIGAENWINHQFVDPQITYLDRVPEWAIGATGNINNDVE